jgi:hypothetical protein
MGSQAHAVHRGAKWENLRLNAIDGMYKIGVEADVCRNL